MIARGQHGRLVEILADLAAQGGFDGAEARERRGQPVRRVGDALEAVDVHCRRGSCRRCGFGVSAWKRGGVRGRERMMKSTKRASSPF